MLHADDCGNCLSHTERMLPSIPESSLVTHAAHAAIRAASSAGVRIADEHEMDQLRNITDLLIGVWGTSQHGAPIPADLLRSFSHAGSNVTAAYDASGSVCGAAVGIVTPDASIYSLIAGVRPGLADRGVGFALKQHQRAWALARGIETMVWTFDPLVSRNARFNLTKLGAHSEEYIENFYGVMDDEINANDESDRLVAVWPLSGERALAGSDGRSERSRCRRSPRLRCAKSGQTTGQFSLRQTACCGAGCRRTSCRCAARIPRRPQRGEPPSAASSLTLSRLGTAPSESLEPAGTD